MKCGFNKLTKLPPHFDLGCYRVEWTGDKPTPAQQKELLCACQNTADAANSQTNNQKTHILNVQVVRDYDAARRLGAFHSSNPPEAESSLATLPKTKYVDIFEDPKRGWAALKWAGHARIFWLNGSDQIGLYLPDDDPGTLWMLRYFCLNLYAAFNLLLPIHGCLLRWRDNNLLIGADSGHGKTTAALAALEEEAELFVEDVVYLGYNNFARTLSARHFINVRPRTLMIFPWLRPEVDIEFGDSFEQERARQLPINMRCLETDLRKPTEVQIDAFLHLTSDGEYRTELVQGTVQEANGFLRSSIPDAPVYWVHKALSNPPTPQKNRLGLAEDVSTFRVSWSIENLGWHSELFQELLPEALDRRQA